MCACSSRILLNEICGAEGAPFVRMLRACSASLPCVRLFDVVVPGAAFIATRKQMPN